jgi:hypothetical protein
MFQRVIRRARRLYAHKEMGDALNYLTRSEVMRRVIPKMPRDTGISYPTLRDWHNQPT